MAPYASVEGARQLPTQHITIRVPWHDRGWDGCVCDDPLGNTSCLILRRIGEEKQDAVEVRRSGQRLDQIASDAPGDLPPCVGERASFMAPFALTRSITHPYSSIYPDTHSHYLPTLLQQPSYTAACVPFRWMLREEVEGDVGLAERLKLGWIPEQEPDIRNPNGTPANTAWLQERGNQLALLDTFFSAVTPGDSLCFFYAKRTPLSEQSRRVIIGVGRVSSVGEAVEYRRKDDAGMRCVLWERNVGHSIRPGFADGFLFPYREALALAEEEGVAPEDLVAFAPDDHFDEYSYGSELLSQDGAVASLLVCASSLRRIQTRIEGPWDQALAWIDTELNRIWRARGAFPGLGSAIAAFGYEWGFQHGTLLAYEIQLKLEREGGNDPWGCLDSITEDPAKLGGSLAGMLTSGFRSGWQELPRKRRALLRLLARCALTEDQALRIYDKTERSAAGINLTDEDVLGNPYLLYEQDRSSLDPISFAIVDRGMFSDVPGDANREDSALDDPADQRRVRALTVRLLEEAASEGHALLPRSWLILRAREEPLHPPCPLGESVLDTTEPSFGGVVGCSTTGADEPAYQLDRLVTCRTIIRKEVNGRRRGRPHGTPQRWREVVDKTLGDANPDGEEERRREEKAAALEQLFRSRLSVLVGPAGTGKTTVLKMLCSLLPRDEVLLLAPTGKARVRLEEQTERRGSGQTLAQFLMRYRRYRADTRAYFPFAKAERCADYRTVIVDECSMLTEEQLAALFDALHNVERFVLVGDPHQLPPIGTGRPFADIVRNYEPAGVDTRFPRCDGGYAELTIPSRQRGRGRPDVLLATQFAGRAMDPGVDAVLDNNADDGDGALRLVQWNHPQDLVDKLLAEMIRLLELDGADDEVGFEESLGGNRFADLPHAFFRNEYGDHTGAAAKADGWQILSPIRAGSVGVDWLNRMIQDRFRSAVRERAEAGGWTRKVPQPIGPQSILYGDKVINVVNSRRRDVWPKPEGEAYVANGDIGIVVGQYKGRKAKYKGLPWKIEVEFAGQRGYKYGFSRAEFGDEGNNPLELAYALTVHRTQGSEFTDTLVVLTNPCWLLSRELLYTALTRHRKRLVVLHQGPLATYRSFSSDQHSEVARRMTNLFSAPTPKETAVGSDARFLEDGLIHRTENGDLVRSKSEVIIADKLYSRGIDYAYEQPLRLPSGRVRYPDFTITDYAMGITFYWEHLGLLNDPGYRARWKRKRAEYTAAGIRPWQRGDDAEHVLIETQDGPEGGIDSVEVARLIDEVIAG
ncbi:MAG: AAA family ATPase [Gammaproteobacteria bacterium]|nr:AAA family ATPase [Gammaproteobacteria bacterium]